MSGKVLASTNDGDAAFVKKSAAAKYETQPGPLPPSVFDNKTNLYTILGVCGGFEAFFIICNGLLNLNISGIYPNFLTGFQDGLSVLTDLMSNAAFYWLVLLPIRLFLTLPMLSIFMDYLFRYRRLAWISKHVVIFSGISLVLRTLFNQYCITLPSSAIDIALPTGFGNFDVKLYTHGLNFHDNYYQITSTESKYTVLQNINGDAWNNSQPNIEIVNKYYSALPQGVSWVGLVNQSVTIEQPTGISGEGIYLTLRNTSHILLLQNADNTRNIGLLMEDRTGLLDQVLNKFKSWNGDLLLMVRDMTVHEKKMRLLTSKYSTLGFTGSYFHYDNFLTFSEINATISSAAQVYTGTTWTLFNTLRWKTQCYLEPLVQNCIISKYVYRDNNWVPRGFSVDLYKQISTGALSDSCFGLMIVYGLYYRNPDFYNLNLDGYIVQNILDTTGFRYLNTVYNSTNDTASVLYSTSGNTEGLGVLKKTTVGHIMGGTSHHQQQ